jgi:peptidoglycan glycosyltransferase
VNRQIGRLGIALLIGYLILFVQLNRLQFFNADEFTSHPENSRPLIAEFGAPRGEMRTIEGDVVANSIDIENGPFARQRTYPLGSLFAEVTGAFSFNAGPTGLEAEWDPEMRGDRNTLTDGLRELLGGESTTADLQLTLSTTMQEAARDALGERAGSVVVLDVNSGGALALWSWPTFDPNPLSDIDTSVARAARQQVLADDSNPLLARTFRELYFPGSTFKVVTGSAALDADRATLDSPVFQAVTSYTPPLTTNPISNFADGSCGGPLRDLIRRSCNAGMAQLAVELLGPQPLVDTAEGFGFNSVPPLDVPGAVASVMPEDFGDRIGSVDVDPALLDQLETPPDPVDLTDDAPSLAQSAIGQFDVKATPLQMALVAGAIANGGEVPRPHVVQSVIDSTGSVIFRADEDPWRRAVRQETAAEMREAMIGVVDSGTGQSVAVEGLLIGAKTGTAQLGKDIESTHAWVIAFAEDPFGGDRIAVAVLVEADEAVGEQTGGRVAGPVAQEVIAAWNNIRADLGANVTARP